EECDELLAPLRVRAGGDEDLGESALLDERQEEGLDLVGRDVLAAGHDDVVRAAQHAQALCTALGVLPAAQIARDEQAVSTLAVEAARQRSRAVRGRAVRGLQKIGDVGG